MLDNKSSTTIPLRKRLAYKTTRDVVIISLALGLVISAIQIYLDLSLQKKTFAETTEQVINTMRQPAAKSANDLDEHLAKEIAEGLFVYDSIVEVQINDDLNNQILLAKRPRQASEYQWAADILFDRHQEFLVTLINNNFKGSVVGEMRVVVDSYNAAMVFFKRAILILTLGLVRNFLLALVLSVFFYFVLAKPLSRVSRKLKLINPENPSNEQLPELQSHKDDELGLMVNSTNKLFQSIGVNINKRLIAESELKAAYDDLEKSVRKFRGYFELPLSGIAIFDQEGRWIELNDRMCEIVGYPREELMSFLWTEATHPDDIEPSIHLIDEIKNNQRDQYTIEKRYVGKDGKITYVEASVGCVRNREGFPEYYIALVQDISFRKEQQRALEDYRKNLENLVKQRTSELVRINKSLENEILERKNSEAKLYRLTMQIQSILDSAGEGIYGLDVNGYTTFANPAAEKMLGYSLEEMMGHSQHTLIHHSKPDGTLYPRDECPIYEAIKDGSVHRITEEVFWRNDGTSFPVEYVSTPIYEDDVIVGAVVTFMDITERKKDEKLLDKYAEELKRSNKNLEDFASIASHDLQEPLRKVIAFGDRLKEKTMHLDEVSVDYIDRMQKSTMRMQAFINDLLSYSRVTTVIKPFERIDLNCVIKEALLNLEGRIFQTKGIVNVGDMPKLSADPFQMCQLFQNLIGNALKYHKAGIVPVVNIECQHSGEGEFKIVIEDNGVGFDEKYAEKIFKPFQRLHGRSEYEGTGIGLAICEKIVDRHNGTITVKSALGEGSTFIVTLPEKQTNEN